ncbi:MAG: glycosyltransferase [Paludibacteraceae bacterium]|nr:glycosyltransferase [Paludibacteraceae bacterium]
MTNKQSINILVVSDPPAAPGYLPRLRYLCDYLTDKGYHITLLTEQYQSFDFAHDYPIIAVPMYSGGTLDWLTKTIWTLLTNWHNRVFAKRAITQYLPAQEQKYDLVLCTAFSDFPLGAAEHIARYYGVPLLCDIRDLDEQVDDSRYQYHHQAWWTMPGRSIYRAIHIHRRNRVIRAANTITTVSPWHVDFIKRYNINTHLVYNGYNEKQFYPSDIKTDTFRITYIGSLFDWQQSALQIIQQAIREIELPVVLDMHTPQSNPVPFDRLGDVIRRSCVMLVLTNPRTHGMLTTKFYEALGCDKPVICVPSDQGALSKLIAHTHAGIATDDKEQIKAFVRTLYSEWQKNGFTRQNSIHREEFSRKAQTERLEQIINNTL